MRWQDIEWQRCRPAVSERQVVDVEERLGIRFPPSYRGCVQACHGGTPQPNVFDIEDDELGRITTSIGMMLTFDEDDEESVISTFNALADRIPERVVPFAIEGGGDYICFDFRASHDDPEVVYWSHEKNPDEALMPLARRFDDFIAELREE